MKEIEVFFEPENWSLMRFDPVTKQLFFVVVRGVELSKVEHIRLKPGEGIAGTVVSTRESIFVPDTSVDSRFSAKVDKESGFETKSIIAVPMIFQDTVYGVIEIINKNSGQPFSEDEHIVLRTIADFAAIAFANSILFQETLILAHTDPLTGAWNRGKLEVMFHKWEQAASQKRRTVDTKAYATVALVDLNNFKEVNDTYGHPEGDKVLQKAARVMRRAIRENDFLFRTGGDEFLIIMIYPDEKDGPKVERNLKDRLIELREVPVGDSEHLDFAVGIRSGPLKKARALMEEADQNMYDNKKERKTG